MEFKEFRKLMQNQFAKISKNKTQLYQVDATREEMWDTYLAAFPDEERQSHNCNSCKSFIRQYGNIVFIENNKLISIWDFIGAEGEYENVPSKMSELIKSKLVRDIYVAELRFIGTEKNKQTLEDGTIIYWNHLCLDITKFYNQIYKSPEAIMGDMRSKKEVLKRGLDEISLNTIDIVLEMIEQHSIHRGDEKKSLIESVRRLKISYDKLPQDEKDNWCWDKTPSLPDNVAKFRNDVIGTLLVDIESGVDLDVAEETFGRKMDPTNYKRPKKIASKRQIEEASKRVSELGLENSLPRRHSTIDDITVNNVIFLNRDAKKSVLGTNVFDSLKEDLPVNPKKFSKVEEMGIEDFIKNVIPTSKEIELLFDNKLVGNLMTLTSPVNKDAKSLFKWDNGFSWSYKGDVTDSIKEKVKAAGGRIDAELRCSLHWFNYDDLDIHVIEPNGHEIYYGNRRENNPTTASLDVDMNAGSGRSRDAVENITWTDKNRMLEGRYKLIIHNFAKREHIDEGFECEIECDGEVYTFEYGGSVRNNERITVAEFDWSRKDGFKLVNSIDGKSMSTSSSREEWGIGTNKFQRVSLIMLSPNYWDGKEIGNKHYFFILEGCKNPDKVRGFYNEYLRNELSQDRLTFEMLGDKMKVDPSDDQLSGLGFSSTIRNSVICKVKGSFERIIKINF